MGGVSVIEKMFNDCVICKKPMESNNEEQMHQVCEKNLNEIIETYYYKDSTAVDKYKIKTTHRKPKTADKPVEKEAELVEVEIEQPKNEVVSPKKLRTLQPIYKCTNCDFRIKVPKNNVCPECNTKESLILSQVYCVEKILSFNKFINVIISERRIGKTFNPSEWVLEQCIKYKRKFMFIRRFTTQFINALKAFVKMGYSVDKRGVYKKVDKEKEYIGYLTSLSTYNNIRGGEYNKVFYILIDEYGDEITRNPYLNDTEQIDSIITTVLFGKKEAKVFIMCNMNNQYLPLFRKIGVKWNQEFTINLNQDAVAHFLKDTEKTEEQERLEMGACQKWLKSGKYYNFAFKNESTINQKELVAFDEIEFNTRLFCFKIWGIKDTLKYLNYGENKYAIEYCFKCEHNVFVLDKYTAVFNIADINYEKFNLIKSDYFDKKIKYADPYIEEKFKLFMVKNTVIET